MASRPLEKFSYDPEMVKPLGGAFDDRLEFNLTCAPPYVEAWVEYITHEWLHWVSVEACGVKIDEAVIDAMLELVDLQSSCWGGVIPKGARYSSH